MSDSDSAGSTRQTARAITPQVHLLVLFAYFILALIATYPVIVHFTTAVPGDLLADRDQNLWNFWWLKDSLGRGANPFHTDLLYYPYSADLYYHTLALPLGLIGLLPQLLLGLPAAYNTVLLAAFTLSGYGAFRLALLFLPDGTTNHRPPTTVGGADVRPTSAIVMSAFLGGLIFAFTPYTLDALKGQPEVLSLQWMPLYAEMWLRATRPTTGGRPWVYALLAGLFLALAAYSSLYYAVYLVIFTLAHLAYRLIPARKRSSILGPLALVVPTTLVLTLPLLVGLIADRNNPRLAVTADPAHRLAHSADLLSFFAPPHDHVVFGTWQDRPGLNEPPIHDYVGLGYAAFALAILGVVRGWRKPGTKFWVGLGLIALVLAMGPEFQVGRNLTGIPLPFALLEKLPGMDAIAKPERFVVLVRLCMVVPAALGAQWLFSRFAKLASAGAERTAWRVLLPFAALIAMLLVELPIHPRYIDTTPVPTAFSTLAQQPTDGLMELPFATQQVETTGERMLYQTVHGKPIMAGYLSRRYDSPIIDSCSPFWGFISPLDVPTVDIAAPLVVNRPQEVLSFYSIRYLALYSKYGGPDAAPLDPDMAAALERIVEETAASPPIASDDYVRLYKTTPASLDNAPISFHIGSGWYNIEQSEGEPFRWVKEGKAALCVFAPRKMTAALSMEATSFAQDRPITISITGSPIVSATLPAGAFTPISTTPIEWQPGVTEVVIASDSPPVTPQALDPASADQRSLSVGLRHVQVGR